MDREDKDNLMDIMPILLLIGTLFGGLAIFASSDLIKHYIINNC